MGEILVDINQREQVWFEVEGAGTEADPYRFVHVIVDLAHHEVHEGSHFVVTHKTADGADLPNDGVLEVLLTTGAKDVHAVFEAVVEGDFELDIFENPTVTDDGTALAEVNLNRNSSKVATVVATHTPTTSADGDNLYSKWLLGGVGFFADTALARTDTEFNLKQNEQYLFRLTNRSGSGSPCSWVVQWYEHNVDVG